MDELDAIEKKALEQAVTSDDLEVRRKAKLPRLSAKSARIPQPKGWHWNREATAHLGASIRIGAQQAHLLSLVLGDGMKLVLIGLSIGLVASLALTRFVASVLYGVSSTDPATFFGWRDGLESNRPPARYTQTEAPQ